MSALRRAAAAAEQIRAFEAPAKGDGQWRLDSHAG
jgi:hypothetical protein